MLLLGFGNKARQGKDHCANAIKNYYESQNELKRAHGFLRGPDTRVGIFKFAAALYQEVNDFLSIAKSFDYEYAELLKIGIREVRGGEICIDKIPDWVQLDPNPEISPLAPYGKHPKLLQWWGTEYRRAQDTDYWVKKCMNNIPANLDIAMITDVRFPNEAEAVKQRGGYNVNVQRLRTDGTPFYSGDRLFDHPSETALDGYDWDFYIKTKNPHAALVGEQAITLTEYLRSLGKK